MSTALTFCCLTKKLVTVLVGLLFLLQEKARTKNELQNHLPELQKKRLTDLETEDWIDSTFTPEYRDVSGLFKQEWQHNFGYQEQSFIKKKFITKLCQTDAQKRLYLFPRGFQKCINSSVEIEEDIKQQKM